DLVTCHRVVERQPWTAVLRRRAEFLARERITPLAECPFRKLHDVALVHEGHGGEVTIDAMLDGFSYQALRAFSRYGLDSDPRTGGEAYFLHLQLLLQEENQFLYFLRSAWVFNPRVDVFGVLAEDDHVDEVGLFHRRGDAGEVADRPDAGVEVERLADRYVERADTAANRRRQWALDRDDEFFEGVQRLVGEVNILTVDLSGLRPGVYAHPLDLPLLAVSARDRGVDHILHDRRDIDADAITDYAGNDGAVRHIERVIAIDGDRLAVARHLDMVVLHSLPSWFMLA